MRLTSQHPEYWCDRCRLHKCAPAFRAVERHHNKTVKRSPTCRACESAADGKYGRASLTARLESLRAQLARLERDLAQVAA